MYYNGININITQTNQFQHIFFGVNGVLLAPLNSPPLDYPPLCSANLYAWPKCRSQRHLHAISDTNCRLLGREGRGHWEGCLLSASVLGLVAYLYICLYLRRLRRLHNYFKFIVR